MTTFGATSKTLGTLALAMAAIFIFSSTDASAAQGGQHGNNNYHGSYNRGSVNFGFRVQYNRGYGHTEYCAPVREWCEGYYETVCQHVVVCPETYERRFCEPVYETRFDHCGKPIQFCVREGYYQNVCIPARYEDRFVKVFHPGFYKEVAQY